ncbi:hypothetical protein MFUL124B02_42145 [Myxococcus fulvus 124B02]|nr:hypothetical protein MFUL124B02_42145 [Myxococcus fulvus 124B02]
MLREGDGRGEWTWPETHRRGALHEAPGEGEER